MAEEKKNREMRYLTPALSDFLQENILRQSGFEKDLEDIRTHLDCCRGGKLHILSVF